MARNLSGIMIDDIPKLMWVGEGPGQSLRFFSSFLDGSFGYADSKIGSTQLQVVEIL